MTGGEPDRPRPDAAPAGAWFDPIAAFLGPAYLRNAFTKGTVAEVDFLVGALHLGPGDRVLDVGCGPGRHALELARRGCAVLGVDHSEDFLALARGAAEAEALPARFERIDVRDLAVAAEFDAVLCLCQGGFGLLGGVDDEGVVARLAAALRPGGRLALTAFNAAFAISGLEAGETFDVSTGVLHEAARVRDDDGHEREFDLWTTCFTPRELRLLAAAAGLAVDGVYGVAPGRYGRRPPDLDLPEHLLLAHRPAARGARARPGLPPARPGLPPAGVGR